MPMMPSRLPQMRWPSIQVGDQPAHVLSAPITLAPSMMRRETAMISAMVKSAVSSVSTPGVLVTVMPRESAVSTSMLSTPLPKLAISFSWSPACSSTALSMRSVTVGTSTSAVFTASISSARPIGSSAVLSLVLNSSIIRVSTTSGSLRVTTTRGLRLLMRESWLRSQSSHNLNPAGSILPPVRAGVMIGVSLVCTGGRVV